MSLPVDLSPHPLEATLDSGPWTLPSLTLETHPWTLDSGFSAFSSVLTEALPDLGSRTLDSETLDSLSAGSVGLWTMDLLSF